MFVQIIFHLNFSLSTSVMSYEQLSLETLSSMFMSCTQNREKPET